MGRKSASRSAPHGGRIEPGTSEIAAAIARDDLSLYLFEGCKRDGNGDLHITSHRFDEPQALQLIAECMTVLTIHGVAGNDDVVYVGGRDEGLGRAMLRALRAEGFRAARHHDPGLQGLHERNICNLGRRRRGVQLELSRGLRRELVEQTSSSRELKSFADAVRTVIMSA